jgi:hypothetical protein
VSRLFVPPISTPPAVWDLDGDAMRCPATFWYDPKSVGRVSTRQTLVSAPHNTQRSRTGDGKGDPGPGGTRRATRSSSRRINTVITSGSIKGPLSTYTGIAYPRTAEKQKEEQRCSALGIASISCRNLYILAHLADYPNPGTPPSVLASLAARRMASARASAAATPRMLISAWWSPTESANTVSPSNIVFTG